MDTSIITGDRALSLEKWAKANTISSTMAKSLSDAIDDPDETPYLLKNITDSFSKMKKASKKAVRESLIRVQIYCSIHGNSDPIKLSKQLYIAQTMEKLMFGFNILIDGMEEEEEEKEKKK